MNLSSPIINDELDEDTFLPTPGASLANIFTKPSKSTTNSNESLKYIPPKPLESISIESQQDKLASSQSETSNKSSECIIGKVVHAHELVNGVYVSKGKLGFALMRLLNPPHTRLVIFNSAKTTLSSVVASEHLQVTVQENNYITYYDENAKNWSLLFLNSSDVFEVVEELKKNNVNINDHNENIPNKKSDHQVNETQMERKDENVEESNDIETNKHTKRALINRVAMIGHAIVPPQSVPVHSSDSSDENTEPKDKPPPPPRNKGLKPIAVKKSEHYKTIAHSSDSSSEPIENVKVSNIVSVASQANVMKPNTLFAYTHGQVVPIVNNDTMGNSLNAFLSETRINNSEIRININRITDKVDQVLHILKTDETVRPKLLHNIDSTPNFMMEVYQKLLKEYEDKISMKDKFIASLEQQLKFNNNKLSPVSVEELAQKSRLNELTELNDNIRAENSSLRCDIEKLRQIADSKTNEVEKLAEKIKDYENVIKRHEVNCDIVAKLREENTILAETNSSLQREIKEKEDKITEIDCLYQKAAESLEKLKVDLICEKQSNNREMSTKSSNDDFESEIKKIMNNTYKTLAVNFENDQSYSGDEVRAIIAAVIKKTTLSALNSQN